MPPIHPSTPGSHTRMHPCPLMVELSHAHLLASSYTYMRHIQSKMPMALGSDTAPGALCTTDIPHILRHAGVGVLSLWRAPNLGKLACATRIPIPGYSSSSLALTRSHLVAYVVLHPPPVRIPRHLAPTVGRYYATALMLVSQSGRDHLHLHRCGTTPSLR